MTYDPTRMPVSFALVGGRRTPGTTYVEEADAPVKWDERDGPMLAGAFLVGGGRKLVHFKMRHCLLTSADWADWYAYKPTIDRAPAGKRPKAIDVWHPWLVDAKVKSAVVNNIGSPKQSEDGSWEIVIGWSEFRVPKLTLAKPEASQTKPSDDPVDKLIATLTSQAQAERMAGG